MKPSDVSENVVNLRQLESFLDEDFVHFEEAARLLGVSHSTLERLVASKRIAVLRCRSGKRTLYRFFRRVDVAAIALDRLRFEETSQSEPQERKERESVFVR